MHTEQPCVTKQIKILIKGLLQLNRTKSDESQIIIQTNTSDILIFIYTANEKGHLHICFSVIVEIQSGDVIVL